MSNTKSKHKRVQRQVALVQKISSTEQALKWATTNTCIPVSVCVEISGSLFSQKQLSPIKHRCTNSLKLVYVDICSTWNFFFEFFFSKLCFTQYMQYLSFTGPFESAKAMSFCFLLFYQIEAIILILTKTYLIFLFTIQIFFF